MGNICRIALILDSDEGCHRSHQCPEPWDPANATESVSVVESGLWRVVENVDEDGKDNDGDSSRI
jgi:hypothetical protein